MTVVASSDNLAICEWLEDGQVRRTMHRHDELVVAVITQQAQQPQSGDPPSG